MLLVKWSDNVCKTAQYICLVIDNWNDYIHPGEAHISLLVPPSNTSFKKKIEITIWLYLAKRCDYLSWIVFIEGFPYGSAGKECGMWNAMWKTWIWFLGWEDPLEKGKVTHSSILAWRITVHGVTKSRTQLSDFHFAVFHCCLLVE